MSNLEMQRLLSLGLLLLASAVPAQELSKLPKDLPGVANVPHLLQRPTKVVKPVYPPEALQRWIQASIIFDVVLDVGGDVEMIGCDVTCSDARPDMIKAAAAAVRQWHWDPVLVKGKPSRVRTRVPVDFLLDENTPPISVCNVIRDRKWFVGKVVNIYAIAQHLAGLNELTSKDCEGTLTVAVYGDATPVVEDAKYAAFQQALASAPTAVALRGLVQDDNGVGHLGGQRFVLQRVLQCPLK